MAELSNDPLGELDPNITYEINHKGTLHLANAAKAAGVKRFIYMSSCSVYGVATDGDVTEETKPNPQTAYAICKTLCERDLRPLADRNFAVCYFRNATAFGASPRQRFDLVLNNLCGLAWTFKEIKMVSDGTPWSPIVHGLDIAKAISLRHRSADGCDPQRGFQHRQQRTELPRARDRGESREGLPRCQVSFGTQGADNRSYRVNFDKVRKHLPAVECEWDADKGVRQFHDLFSQIDFTKDQFEHRAFTRLKQLQYLIRTSQIDRKFLLENGPINRVVIDSHLTLRAA